MNEMNGPIDVVEFEKEMHARMSQRHGMEAQDAEDWIADAFKRQGNNDRRTALHMHLRLKNGANARPHAMSRHELADLVEMVASNDAGKTITKRLANFYARIAQLRARIEEINSTMTANNGANHANNGANHANNGANHAIHAKNKNSNIDHVLTAYAKNEETRREKQKENQRELARIMESILHPDLTEDDLPALEMHVEHIAERGCATEELRRLKIVEAALEQQRYDELMAELKSGTCAPP